MGMKQQMFRVYQFMILFLCLPMVLKSVSTLHQYLMATQILYAAKASTYLCILTKQSQTSKNWDFSTFKIWNFYCVVLFLNLTTQFHAKTFNIFYLFSIGKN